MSRERQTAFYIGLGIVLTLSGLFWVLVDEPSNVNYDVVEGISVFAALYVIAQSAERVTEWVTDLLGFIPESPEKRKETALQQVRAANSTISGNPTAADFDVTQTAVQEKADAESAVKEARRDIKFLAAGLSVVVCALLVNALNYGLLDHIGANGVDGDIDRLATVLAAAGGTKALHELIGRVQKAKESAEADPQTG